MNQEQILELMEIQRRRRRLCSQLQKVGPEHFNQGSWFHFDEPVFVETGEVTEWYDTTVCDTFGVGAWDENPGVPTLVLGQIDVLKCGATACLAGHGALVAVRDKIDKEKINDRFVADYFDIPPSWFEGDLPYSHPYYNEANKLIDQGMEDYYAHWFAQVRALLDLIDETEKDIEAAEEAAEEEALL